MTDKRRFSRVEFDADATLYLDGKSIDAHIVDLSIHGAKINLIEHTMMLGVKQCDLEIMLGSGVTSINLVCRPVYQKDLTIGLEVVEMDIDSATHLRRLLEVNLGDPKLIERDLTALLKMA
ncbi:MAG: PilZ domain-containing protein [Gammaproteobacteria bacterium]|nr:PilZ domain-containing protein [Gammaproteobacteria bacterium]